MHFLVISALVIIVPLIVVIRNYKKEATFYKTITQSFVLTSAAVIGILLGVYLSGDALGTQFMNIAEAMAGIAASSEEFISQFNLGDMSNDERISYIVNAYAALNDTFPSAIIISIFLSTYFIYMIRDIMYSKKNKTELRLMPIKNFRLPPNFVFGCLLIFLFAWIAEMISPALAEAEMYLNISMIFEFAIAAEGLAVFFFLFDMKKLPKAVPVIIGIFGLVSGIGRAMLFATGFIDYMLNIRLRIAQSGKR